MTVIPNIDVATKTPEDGMTKSLIGTHISAPAGQRRYAKFEDKDKKYKKPTTPFVSVLVCSVVTTADDSTLAHSEKRIS